MGKEMIKLAAKMYHCQDSAKKFFKDDYFQKLKWYVETLVGIMAKYQITEELKAALFACKLPSVGGNAMAVIMFMAAAVELVENPDPDKILSEIKTAHIEPE